MVLHSSMEVYPVNSDRISAYGVRLKNRKD